MRLSTAIAEFRMCSVGSSSESGTPVNLDGDMRASDPKGVTTAISTARANNSTQFSDHSRYKDRLIIIICHVAVTGHIETRSLGSLAWLKICTFGRQASPGAALVSSEATLIFRNTHLASIMSFLGRNCLVLLKAFRPRICVLHLSPMSVLRRHRREDIFPHCQV